MQSLWRRRATTTFQSSYTFPRPPRSEEHTSELQSQFHLVCRFLLEKKKEPLRSVARVHPSSAVCRIRALDAPGRPGPPAMRGASAPCGMVTPSYVAPSPPVVATAVS